MYKIVTSFILFLVISCHLSAQISPKEGSSLNYRLIGFSITQDAPGSKCSIEIAAGNIYNEDSFRKCIISSVACNKNRVISEVPDFGRQYTWRAVFTTTGSIKTTSRLYHFSTGTSIDVDTNNTRLRIIEEAKKNKGAYVFLVGTRALYDMNGKPVWFLSNIEGEPVGSLRISDLKLTPQGTITFMSDRKNGTIYEINYDGDVLWKARGKNMLSDENYHHEFTRLANGHYITLGNDIVLWQLPTPIDSALRNRSDIKDKIVKGSNNEFYQKIYLATVIEYDRKGNVIWRWRSSQYFKQGTDVFYKTNSNGVYQIDDPHLNSFYFDEKENALYLGFRDISRVLKVAYPGGQVLSTYGNPYAHGEKDTAKDPLLLATLLQAFPEWLHIHVQQQYSSHHGSLPKITIIKDPASPTEHSFEKKYGNMNVLLMA